MARAGRVRLATAVAGVLEWYDFSIFGFMANELSANFFAPVNTTSTNSSVSNVSMHADAAQEGESRGLIETLAVFGAAFVARPIGGIVFGHMGDKGCRKKQGAETESLEVRRLKALEASLLAMAVPAVAIAVLPTKASIGAAAPAAMVAVRLLQGLSVGGQLVGALLSGQESAPARRQLFVLACILAACNSGFLLGSAVSALAHTIYSEGEMRAWAWRVPFAFGAVLSLVAYALVRTLRPCCARPRARAEPIEGAWEGAATAATLGGPAAAPTPTPAAAAAASEGAGAEAVTPPPPPTADVTSHHGVSCEEDTSLAASPLALLLRDAVGRRKLFGCVCAWGAHTSTSYTLFVFMPLLEVNYLGRESAPSFMLTATSLLLSALLIPAVAHVAERALNAHLDAHAPSDAPAVRETATSAAPPAEPPAGQSPPAAPPRVGVWAPPRTRVLQRWLGVRLRLVSLSLAVCSPLALYLAQVGAAADRGEAAAWASTTAAVVVLAAHAVAIDALVCGWILSIFAPEVRGSASHRHTRLTPFP